LSTSPTFLRIRRYNTWIFRYKYKADGTVERYKARLGTARGDPQDPASGDYNELFAPVVRFDSLRTLLAISASRKWRPRQLDVKTAFLYGHLKEEIYMRLPLGSRIGGKVCKHKRCLYGLKQSPREWYSRLTNYLLPYGFALSAYDPCVLIHSSGNLFLAIYVDDILIFGPSDDDLTENLIAALKTEFDVKDLGEIHWLLGIKIDLTDDGIKLSQQTYIDKILERFGMQDCHSVSTPLDPNHKLRSGTSEQTDDITLYQQIIGSLMYTVTGTRPDLAYSVTHLSQFSSAPTSTHLQAAKRVLRFLKGTRDVKLTYKLGQPLVLEGFSDASCILRKLSRHSQKLLGIPISTWRRDYQLALEAATLCGHLNDRSRVYSCLYDLQTPSLDPPDAHGTLA
jgi:hypothetical protein